MYICDYCNREFEEPAEMTIDIEDYCGVGGIFPDHHYDTIPVCPYCSSEEFDECDDEEEEEEEDDE